MQEGIGTFREAPAVCRKVLERSGRLLQLAGRDWNVPRGSCGLQEGIGTFREAPADLQGGAKAVLNRYLFLLHCLDKAA